MPHLQMEWEVAPGIVIPNASVYVDKVDVDTIAETFICSLDARDEAGNSLESGLSLTMPNEVYHNLALASRPAVLAILQQFPPGVIGDKHFDFSQSTLVNGALSMLWPWTTTTNVQVSAQIVTVHIDNVQQLLVCYLCPLDGNGAPVLSREVGITTPTSAYSGYVGAQNNPLLTAIQALPSGVYGGKTVNWGSAILIQ